MTAALCHVKSSSGSHCGQFAHSWPHLLLGHPVERRSAGTKRISLQGNSEPLAGDDAATAAAATVRSGAFEKKRKRKRENIKRVNADFWQFSFVGFFLLYLSINKKKIYCCLWMTNIPSFNTQTSICLCLTANAFQTRQSYIWIHLKCKVEDKSCQWRPQASKKHYLKGQLACCTWKEMYHFDIFVGVRDANCRLIHSSFCWGSSVT